MSRSLNKVMLIGNVGSDPEVRTTPSGKRVAKVSLATNWKRGQEDRTEWHRLTFWEGLAEVVERYVKKGDRLYVEGRLEYSQTQDDQGGVKYWTDIVVNEMIMMGSGGGGSDFGGGQGGPRGAGSSAPEPDLSEPDDDLPF
jgi:single-strand DNA-binding protein